MDNQNLSNIKTVHLMLSMRSYSRDPDQGKKLAHFSIVIEEDLQVTI